MSDDRLMQAMQGLEMLDRLDRTEQQRQQQSIENQFKARAEVRQSQQLEIENQRNYLHGLAINLDYAKENRQANESKMILEHQIRAEHAASAAASLVSQIDTFHPNAEQDLNNAMATALGNGVDHQTVQTIFGPKLQQIGFRKNQEAQNYAAQLGEGGRTLFAALQKDGGLDADNALEMTKRSLTAKATFDWYMDYASKNGMPVAVSDDDMSKMRKKVGNLPPGVQVGNGDSFSDLRKDVWDMDEVRRWAATKVLTPELTKKLNDEQRFETDKRNADLAKTRAETSKIGAETAAINGRSGTGPSANFLPNGQTAPNFTPSKPSK